MAPCPPPPTVSVTVMPVAARANTAATTARPDRKLISSKRVFSTRLSLAAQPVPSLTTKHDTWVSGTLVASRRCEAMVARLRLLARGHDRCSIFCRTGRGARVRNQPGRRRGELGGAAGGEPPGAVQVRVERHAQRVGEQLAPGRMAAAAPAELERGRGGAEHAQVLELAAEQERDALQRGAQQVVPLVSQGQAGPRAAGGALIPALAGQVRQEDRGVRAPRPGGGAVQLVPAGAERAPYPVQRHADVLRGGQPVGAPVRGAEQVGRGTSRIRIVRKWSIRGGGGGGVRGGGDVRGGDEKLAAGAEGEQAAPGREVRGEEGGGGVGGADGYREGGGQAQVAGGGGEQGAGEFGGRADGG